MASGPLVPVIDFLRKVVAPSEVECQGDGQLLRWFVEHGDEDAFTALVQRHGPMVYAVCRRVLNDAHDADDAFQATFLVLARKAGAIRKRESLASWLHGVAYRTAVKARARDARRQAHEREAPDMPRADPLAELAWRELRPVLDSELERLPEKYRAPLVLCYLEGKTNEAAARQLGWTKGTVSGRLARARALLRGRLARRGLGLSGGVLATALSLGPASAAVPAPLVTSTVKAAALVAVGQAAAGVSAPVAALVEGVLQAMCVTKVKVTAAVLLAVTVLGAGAGVLTCGSPAADVLPGGQAVAAQPAPARAGKAQTDQQKLQGTWRVVAAQRFGRAEENTVGSRLTFAGDRFTVVQGDGSPAGAGTFALVPTKTPKELYIREEGKEDTAAAIYRLEGDTLTLCVNEHSQVPPVAFAAEAGTKPRLLNLRRDAGADPANLQQENERLRRELQRTREELEQARAEVARLRALAEKQFYRAEIAAAEREAQAAQNQAVGTADEKRRSVNNLKQIGLAMHNFHDTYKHLPPAAIYGKDGKPLLSWRVAILPYLDQDNLYRQFKLDEPWDSPHNKKLLEVVPAPYVPVRGKAPAGSTFYQVFTGPHTLFEGKQGMRFSQVTDGLSNTILVAEAGKAVPWTKPADLPYAADKALPKLGGLFGNGFHILWADGSVRFVRQPVNEQMLRWAITRDDGNIVDHDKLER
jgi:RNA polymerase sigma factor (sigma-70 family)